MGLRLTELASALELPASWEELRRPEQVALAPAFLRAFESSGLEGVRTRYFLGRRGGRLVAGAAVHRVEVNLGEQRLPWTAELTRRAHTAGRPELLRFRCLICGLNASQGRDDVVSGDGAPDPEFLSALAERLEEEASEEDLDGVVFGHVHGGRLPPFEALRERGYLKLPSLPYATLPVTWDGLSDYLSRLRAGYRRQASASLRRLADAGFEVCSDLPLAAWSDRFFPLYEAVVSRAEQRIETLTPAFFRRLGEELPREVSLVGLCRRGELAAGAVVFASRDRLSCLEVGLDYGQRDEGELYANLLLALADRAGALGVAHLDLGQTAAAAKTRLGARLEPTWLLVKARSPVTAAALGADRPHLAPEEPLRRRVFREEPSEPPPAPEEATDARDGAHWARHVNPDLATLLALFRLDRTYVRGDGSLLWDDEGREVLDFACGYGALPFGHNPRELWEAVDELRSSSLPNFVQGSLAPGAGALARELSRLAPEGLDRCLFANSGAEAVELAIKAARAATGRPEVVVATRAFHGKTLGALSATADPWYQEPFFAPAEHFVRVPYGDAEALERTLAERRGRVAAFLVEPILGEGGAVPPPAGYLASCAEVCRRNGVLLLVDEVQTGLGRTGRLFACEEEGISPDALLLSKALSGGLVPAAACLLSERAWSEALALRHSSTFAGGALAAAVGLAVLRRLTADDGALLSEVRRKGELFVRRLRAIAAATGVLAEVRGRGLLLGLELGGLDECGSPTLRHLSARGELVPLLCGYLLNTHGLRVMPALASRKTLRMLPPLNVSETALDRAADALEETCGRLAAGDVRGLSRYLLPGAPAEPPPRSDASSPARAHRAARDSGDGPPAGRFAFLVHALDLESYRSLERSLAHAPASEVAGFQRLLRDLVEVLELSFVRLRSPTGARCEGWFLGLPFTARELLALSAEERLRWLRAGAAAARKRGARLLGLGAYTGVVSRGGLALRDQGLALTTGNAYTVATALDALRRAALAVGVEPRDSTCAILGATGSIGSTCAELLAGGVGRLVLIGNPARSDSAARLAELAREVQARSERPVEWTLDAEPAIRRAELVLCATAAGHPVVDPAWLRAGAVVCDVAKPPDVSTEVGRRRNDVLVIDGGVVELPGGAPVGWDFGFEPGIAYACMAETLSLAFEGRTDHFSLGPRLTPAQVTEAEELARRHGFRPAGFRNRAGPVSEADVAAVREALRGARRPRPR